MAANNIDDFKRIQDEILEEAQMNCTKRFTQSVLDNRSPPIFDATTKELYCPPVWDGLNCWGRATANTTTEIACPSYVLGFKPNMNVTRMCSENGTWFNSVENKAWSNYSQCTDNKSHVTIFHHNMEHDGNLSLLEQNLHIIKSIRMSGCAVSFVVLAAALVIMVSFKRLHCPRNKLHMQLFASFLLKAFLSLIKDITFVNGIGLPSDFIADNKSEYYFHTDETKNWECKLITSLWEYSITANYMWLLMEGLYLYNLIFRAMFIDSNRNILLYIGLGWTLPLTIVGPWVVMKVKLDDVLCWTKHSQLALQLMIQIPTMISILINLVLFIRISIVLYTKLQSPINFEQAQRYQKWAKSTLVLVPLFGIHYSIFLVMSFTIETNQAVEFTWVLCDQLFGSFQGAVVAILYCFLNGEVKTELHQYFHNLLTCLATSAWFRFCFPCREQYLSSARGRTSVCTTMSCSSLYTNGLHHHRNSRSKWDLFPKSKHSAISEKPTDHVCHPRVRSWHDVSKPNGRAQNGFMKNSRPYGFSPNGCILTEEANFCHMADQERSQSEPHLIEEEEMIMISAAH